MTERTDFDQFDRQIQSFLAWQARDIVDAPTASEVADRISARAGTRVFAPRLAPQLLWIVLAGLLAAALVGAALVGASLLRDDPLPSLRFSYEAVFLRLEVVDGEPSVLVIGVDPNGRERDIARLNDAWVAYDIPGSEGYLAPMGAISPSGLLAIPALSSRDGNVVMMRWEVIDIYAPGSAHLVVDGIDQDLDQLRTSASFYDQVDGRGGVFWGPSDNVAIAWYLRAAESSQVGLDRRLTFVDGGTGEASSVDISEELALFPQWAADASGVVVSSDRRLLRPDGTVGALPVELADPACRTRYASGAEVDVLNGRMVRRGHPDASWEMVASTDRVGYACLAPDDSAIVHSFEIGTGAVTAASPLGRIISTETGEPFDIDGSFAGWLEVPRRIVAATPAPPITENGWIAYSTQPGYGQIRATDAR